MPSTAATTADFRDHTGKLNPNTLATALANDGSLRRVGRLAGISGERVRQVLAKAGYNPAAGRQARRERRNQRMAVAMLAAPHDVSEFLGAAVRDGLLPTGLVGRTLTIGKQKIRIHEGKLTMIRGRPYVRVGTFTPSVIHLVRLEGPAQGLRGWLLIPVRHLNTAIPLVPKYGGAEGSRFSPIDLSVPGSVRQLLAGKACWSVRQTSQKGIVRVRARSGSH